MSRECPLSSPSSSVCFVSLSLCTSIPSFCIHSSIHPHLHTPQRGGGSHLDNFERVSTIVAILLRMKASSPVPPCIHLPHLFCVALLVPSMPSFLIHWERGWGTYVDREWAKEVETARASITQRIFGLFLLLTSTPVIIILFLFPLPPRLSSVKATKLFARELWNAALTTLSFRLHSLRPSSLLLPSPLPSVPSFCPSFLPPPLSGQASELFARDLLSAALAIKQKQRQNTRLVAPAHLYGRRETAIGQAGRGRGAREPEAGRKDVKSKRKWSRGHFLFVSSLFVLFFPLVARYCFARSMRFSLL